MKSDLKAKLLQHLSGKKKGNGGFTLIELLVVIIIIGILSAIALPSFLNQANKAKQSEAKTYVGSMNRAQQAYYLENSAFTTSSPQLGLGIATSTENYSYAISSANASSVTNKGVSTKASLKSYAGGVALADVAGGGTDKTTIAVLCEASSAGTAAVGNATSNATSVTCPTSTEQLR